VLQVQLDEAIQGADVGRQLLEVVLRQVERVERAQLADASGELRPKSVVLKAEA
jgi:hypothetical protein